jgi:hypothetical protein
LLAAWINPRFGPLIGFALACGGVVLFYVLRGWSLSGTGLRGMIDLACAPAFVIWKFIAVRGPRAEPTWTRTDRERS